MARGPRTQKRQAANKAAPGGDRQHFRFFDNREKYLLFVTTCSEKWMVAQRIGMELSHLRPRPPALKLFDAGMGDGTVLSHVMRDLHRQFPHTPWLIVGKEISMEDVRLSLEKLADRFFEHPQTIVCVTNMYYTEAPHLMPRTDQAMADLQWFERPLEGNSARDFDEQIRRVTTDLMGHWQVRVSERTGNPLYVKPCVLVLYRKDHSFVLDPFVPRRGQFSAGYDLIIASQPYRARMAAEFKAGRVLAPLAASLAPGGRMFVVQSHGRDPGMEIIHSIWPDESPFRTPRAELLSVLKSELKRDGSDFDYIPYANSRSLFRYHLHTLPSEVGSSIGTSTILAAWNAAAYVAQIEDHRMNETLANGNYLEATAAVVREHGGLWFNDESFVVARKPARS